jgi:hypothetical protein
MSSTIAQYPARKSLQPLGRAARFFQLRINNLPGQFRRGFRTTMPGDEGFRHADGSIFWQVQVQLVVLGPFVQFASKLRHQFDNAAQLADSRQGCAVISCRLGFLLDALSFGCKLAKLSEQVITVSDQRGISGFCEGCGNVLLMAKQSGGGYRNALRYVSKRFSGEKCAINFIALGMIAGCTSPRHRESDTHVSQ